MVMQSSRKRAEAQFYTLQKEAKRLGFTIVGTTMANGYSSVEGTISVSMGVASG